MNYRARTALVSLWRAGAVRPLGEARTRRSASGTSLTAVGIPRLRRGRMSKSEHGIRRPASEVAAVGGQEQSAAKRYGLRQISIQKTQVGNTCRRKGNS